VAFGNIELKKTALTVKNAFFKGKKSDREGLRTGCGATPIAADHTLSFHFLKAASQIWLFINSTCSDVYENGFIKKEMGYPRKKKKLRRNVSSTNIS